MAQVKLDLTNNSAYTGKTILPTGIYNMVITRSEVKETKKGGHMLELDYTVLDGEKKESFITDRINIAHSNPDVVKYGLNALKTILTVGGHSNPNYLGDTDEMLGLKVKLSVEEQVQMKDGQPVTDDNGKPYRENKIKGTFKYDGQAAPAQETKAADSPSPAQEAPAPSPAPTPAPAQGEQSFPWNS